MSAGAAGAAAAAAAARRREQEEEEMAGYSAAELEGWEFKFVRSATSAFRRPEFLRRILEEEKRAGWELVEKFDNGRIRLKRRVSARSGDAGASVDPYRSHVGISELRMGLTIAGSVIGAIVLIALVAASIAAANRAHPAPGGGPAPPARAPSGVP